MGGKKKGKGGQTPQNQGKQAPGRRQGQQQAPEPAQGQQIQAQGQVVEALGPDQRQQAQAPRPAQGQPAPGPEQAQGHTRSHHQQGFPQGQGRGQAIGRGQRPPFSQAPPGRIKSTPSEVSQSLASLSVSESVPAVQENVEHQKLQPQQQQNMPAQTQQKDAPHQQTKPAQAQQQQTKPAQVQQQQTVPVQPQQQQSAPTQVQPQQLVMEKFAIKLRTTQGRMGRPTRVETNHLAIQFKPRKSGPQIVYHYDIKFVPDKPTRLYRAAFVEFRDKACQGHHPAFDGRANVYSYGALPFGDSYSIDVNVYDDDRAKSIKYAVTVNAVNKLDFTLLTKFIQDPCGMKMPRECMQALDVVMREASCDVNYIKVGRSYFPIEVPGRVENLGNGLETWVGSFQSAILGWKPFLNIDVAHKGFPKRQPVMSLIDELYGNPENFQRNGPEQLEKFLRGLKVDYEIPGQPNSKRTYRVNGVKPSADQLKFNKEENGKEVTTTVAAYFHQDRGYKLRHPQAPCLWVGSLQNKVCLPIELCTVQGGQVVHRKLDDQQTSKMVRTAATSADERKRKILEGFKKLGINHNPSMEEFGITVSEHMEQVDARVLKAPDLAYNQQKLVSPFRGVWRADRNQFLTPAKATNWAILNLERRTRDDRIKSFAESLVNESKKMGMELGSYKGYSSSDPYPEKLERKLGELRDCSFLVVIVPDFGSTYSTVKQKAELQFGILTQCVKSNTVSFKANPATINNILLKINAKLNGVNHSLHPNSKPPCFAKPIMIMGADVTHPSPDATHIPSIAAVTASHDPQAFLYNTEFRLQPPRMEIIEELELIVRSQLLFFYRKTKYQPDRIIFYRDGVGDTQFKQVLSQEMTAIRRACQSLSQNYKPKVTFLVVQKRHHTRFFPTRKEDEDGKNKNVPPGLVVDTMITNPTEMQDFYLVSHQSIQGTSRPTKYCVLHDDANMSEDEVEQLTYYLCHLFSRCNRSVSYPAPTYYAHLAAFRAKAYIEGKNINLQNLAHEQKLLCKIKDNILADSPMYFV